MAYRLKPSENLPDGVRRIARQQIERALTALHERGGPGDEAIHDARRRFKKLRSLLRLVRGELGGKAYRAENAHYRDLGRRFSAWRDAAMMLETYDALAGRFPISATHLPSIEPARDWLVARREAILAEAGDPAAVAAQVSELLAEGRIRIADWPLKHDGFGALEPGLRQIYADGRKALAVALAEPTDEHFHELRKQVKHHYFHSRLLAEAWPARMKAYRASLKALADLLGHDHDLAVLRQTLLGAGDAVGGEAALAPLLTLAGERQSELRIEALRLARRVYAEKPSALAARMRAYWKSVQGKR